MLLRSSLHPVRYISVNAVGEEGRRRREERKWNGKPGNGWKARRRLRLTTDMLRLTSTSRQVLVLVLVVGPSTCRQGGWPAWLAGRLQAGLRSSGPCLLGAAGEAQPASRAGLASQPPARPALLRLWLAGCVAPVLLRYEVGGGWWGRRSRVYTNYALT